MATVGEYLFGKLLAIYFKATLNPVVGLRPLEKNARENQRLCVGEQMIAE